MVLIVVTAILSGGLLIWWQRGRPADPSAGSGAPIASSPVSRRAPGTTLSPTAGPAPASARATVPSPAATLPGTRRHSGVGVAIPGIRLLYDPPATVAGKLDRVAALGAGWLRFDVAWPEIEIERGRYDFTRVDRVLTGARSRGLRVVLILGGSAGWARPAGADWNHGPADATAQAGFAGFAATTAQRYRGRVDAYEIWNEPNLPGSWAPAPDPAAYLAVLRGAYAAIHRADPGAVVISGGTGGGTTGIDTLSWYTTLYKAGLAKVTDGIAVHPYPDARHPAGTGEMARARRVRALMDAHGDRGTPLWGTETGTATGGANAASEADQASLVAELHRQWQRIHTTGPLMYYTLYDFGGADREHHFGLLRSDGSAKPAYAVLRDRVIG